MRPFTAEHALLALRPQRICIIKPSALGDVVQSLPILSAIKAAYPAATISWVINRELAPLLEGHPLVDNLLVYDRRGSWTASLAFLWRLAKSRFDLVFDLQGLLRTGVMTVATRARTRVGLQTAREGSRFTVNCVISESSRQQPAWSRYLRVNAALNQPSQQSIYDLPIPTSLLAQADARLATLPRPWLVVQPGAKWETKRWPPQQFAAVLSLAHETFGGSAILVGTNSEAEVTAECRRAVLERNPAATVEDLAGQTTLLELAALLSRANVVLSNDSGPLHLASAVGAPVVGIFTCTSAHISGPPPVGPGGAIQRYVSTIVSCAASYHKRCPHAGTAKHACFGELTADRVWKALSESIQHSMLSTRSRD